MQPHLWRARLRGAPYGGQGDLPAYPIRGRGFAEAATPRRSFPAAAVSLQARAVSVSTHRLGYRLMVNPWNLDPVSGGSSPSGPGVSIPIAV